MAAPLLWKRFAIVPDQGIDLFFVCPICHEWWDNPVELLPCGDIFCQRCIDRASTSHASKGQGSAETFPCPQCHAVVRSERRPNRALLNTVLSIEVQCIHCVWRGTREAAEQHRCAAKQSSKGSRIEASSREEAGMSSGHPTSPTFRPGHPQRDGPAFSSSPAVSTPPRAPRHLRYAEGEIEKGYIPFGENFASASGELLSSSSNVAPPTSGTAGAVTTEQGPTRSTQADHSTSAAFAAPTSPHGVSGGTPQQYNSGSRTSLSDEGAPATYLDEPWRLYGLTQMQYDQLVGIFMMFDGGNGRLGRLQLRQLCFLLNFVQREDDVDTIFRSMDNHHKGYVSQHDFLLWLSTHQPDPSSLFGFNQFEYLDAILQFHSADVDSTGMLDARRFVHFCQSNEYTTTPEEAMHFFHHIDENQTGYIGLQQYLRVLKLIQASRRGEADIGSSGGRGSGGGPRQLRHEPMASTGLQRGVGAEWTSQPSSSSLPASSHSPSLHGSGGLKEQFFPPQRGSFR